jgi:hypothetical protein
MKKIKYSAALTLSTFGFQAQLPIQEISTPPNFFYTNSFFYGFQAPLPIQEISTPEAKANENCASERRTMSCPQNVASGSASQRVFFDSSTGVTCLVSVACD